MVKFVLVVFNGLQARVLRVYAHAVGNVIVKRMPRVGCQFAIQLHALALKRHHRLIATNCVTWAAPCHVDLDVNSSRSTNTTSVQASRVR